MCGIFCSIFPNINCPLHKKDVYQNEWNCCQDAIRARGPDSLTEHSMLLTEKWHGHFAGSVLWMQGTELVPQPVIDSDGNILLWNGDIFNGKLAEESKCDTLTVLSNLSNLSPSADIASVFKEIQGPYSFIYFRKSNNQLYFGRDFIGRHSLLLKIDTEKNQTVITSVASKRMKGIVEIPAIGIFMVNLNSSRINLTCNPWNEPDLRFTDIIEALEKNLEIDIDIKETIFTHSCMISNLVLHPSNIDVEYLETIPCSENPQNILQYLLKNENVNKRVEHLSHLLHKAVEVRIKKKQNFCKDCLQMILKGKQINKCTHSKIGILFSGGLDSAILCAIAHKYVPLNENIDLINVAFEKPTNIKNINSMSNDVSLSEKYNVPDRKTGRQTYSELLNICPDRKWNLIEINVPQDELQKYRSSRICDLLYPLCTILDESLGCAVWFASRAKGVLSTTGTAYESPCRVLLLGMGADELFGGYMRHRTILKHKGWDALTQELHVEIARISERNLGRDDRIISDHGRQSRLPYLDEDVVEYAQKLKPWERCYPTNKMPSGLGDKLVLRLLACKLGFQDTATFPKRAFQFGSRIANGKENAKSISERL